MLRSKGYKMQTIYRLHTELQRESFNEYAVAKQAYDEAVQHCNQVKLVQLEHDNGILYNEERLCSFGI